MIVDLPAEVIEKKIFYVRGQKVMLDRDLAKLYNVETRRLVEQVKRNIDRFPDDFMFQLTKEEFANLKSQFATSSWGGTRKHPHVFTEQGVAMLSSVLHSKRAIEVNVAIMRAFVKLREMLASNTELAKRLEEMEHKYDEKFRVVFDAIKALMAEPDMPKEKIGFKGE